MTSPTGYIMAKVTLFIYAQQMLLISNKQLKLLHWLKYQQLIFLFNLMKFNAKVRTPPHRHPSQISI